MLYTSHKIKADLCDGGVGYDVYQTTLKSRVENVLGGSEFGSSWWWILKNLHLEYLPGLTLKYMLKRCGFPLKEQEPPEF